jgi:hypothetical protein
VVGCQRYAPATFPLGKGPGIHFYRKLGEPHSRSERVGGTSSLPVFDPRTVQPVVSRYADLAVAALIVTIDV